MSKGNKGSDLSSSSKKKTYHGGAYSSLKGGQDIHRHHIPAQSISGLGRSKGPAIEMEATDHVQTKSFGRATEAVVYRSEIKELVDSDQMRDAIAREIKDVRRIAGKKYNQAIKEMLDYSKERGILDK